MVLSESAVCELLDVTTHRPNRGSDPRVGADGASAHRVRGDRRDRCRPLRTQRHPHQRAQRRPPAHVGDRGWRHRPAHPQAAQGSFFPVILEPRRRIDQALYAVVMEAYVARRVDPFGGRPRVNKEIKRRARVVGLFPQRGRRDPPGSARSWPTCTTSGNPATAAISPKPLWPRSSRPAMVAASPQSTAASRHRGSTLKPTTRRGTTTRYALSGAMRSLERIAGMVSHLVRRRTHFGAQADVLLPGWLLLAGAYLLVLPTFGVLSPVTWSMIWAGWLVSIVMPGVPAMRLAARRSWCQSASAGVLTMLAVAGLWTVGSPQLTPEGQFRQHRGDLARLAGTTERG